MECHVQHLSQHFSPTFPAPPPDISPNPSQGVYLDGYAQGSGTQVHHDPLQGAAGLIDDQLAQLAQVALQPLLWQGVEAVAEVVLHTV